MSELKLKGRQKAAAAAAAASSQWKTCEKHARLEEADEGF